ncbi:MAG: ATP-binding protein [Deltaproteobacteria bacterium]|nr:ATP-binding protein [Deltaproteobacteria bacterium]
MRTFNVAGPCRPELHYMLDPVARVSEARTLIERMGYFVLHAPRQTGKTTSLQALARVLNAEGRYAALHFSCAPGQAAGDDYRAAQEALLYHMQHQAAQELPAELQPAARWPEAPPLALLTAALTGWARCCPRPLVLFFDEIDALTGSSLLAVLRQLHAGYPNRPHAFPWSVVLCGLREVRDYKLLAGGREPRPGSASPFNILVESLRLASFSAEEVAALYGQHTAQTGQGFAEQAVHQAFCCTRGQPWLVNALAREVIEKMGVQPPEQIRAEHIEQARERLISSRATHLDSLVARLAEPRVRRIIEPILVGAASFDATFDDDFSYVRDLGLVERQEGVVTIANPIYAEIIPRVLSAQVQAAIPDRPAWFVTAEGTLDVAKLLEGFLTFWRRNGEVLLKGMPYHEAAPHLVFMAYLQRVVNAGGRILREFAVGTGRADLLVDFGGREDVFELKLFRGSYTRSEGIEQVARYARRLGRDRGYLLLFDLAASTLPWEERVRIEEVEQEGITVVVVLA